MVLNNVLVAGNSFMLLTSLSLTRHFAVVKRVEMGFFEMYG